MATARRTGTARCVLPLKFPIRSKPSQSRVLFRLAHLAQIHGSESKYGETAATTELVPADPSSVVTLFGSVQS